jgi:hypothetical protein
VILTGIALKDDIFGKRTIVLAALTPRAGAN